jgi:hypothetical protein
MSNGDSPRGTTISLPVPLHERLSDEVRESISQWQHILHHDTGVIIQTLPTSASRSILTVAVNDALSLVDHIDRFDGRAAALLARALFEHWMNICDVLDKPEQSDRFERHRFVTAQQISANIDWVSLLTPAQRDREERRLKKLGRITKAPFKASLSDYGGQFKRGWAVGSLKDRADNQGAGDQYESYRILSSVVHGTSGGLNGLVHEFGEHRSHLVGADFGFLPQSYAEGLYSFCKLAERIDQSVASTEAHDFVAHTALLMNHLSEIYREIEKEKARIWPTGPSVSILAIAAVYPSGKVNWYLHNATEGTVVRADPVGETPDMSAIVDAAQQASLIRPSRDPVLATVEGAILTAKSGATYGPWEGLKGRDDFEFISRFLPRLDGIEVIEQSS